EILGPIAGGGGSLDLGLGGGDLLRARLLVDQIAVSLLHLDGHLGVPIARQGAIVLGLTDGAGEEPARAVVFAGGDFLLYAGLIEQSAGMSLFLLLVSVFQFLQLGGGGGQGCLGLQILGLVAGVVDLEQQIAGLDRLALFRQDDARDDAAN